jgi:hypothetical protein
MTGGSKVNVDATRTLPLIDGDGGVEGVGDVDAVCASAALSEPEMATGSDAVGARVGVSLGVTDGDLLGEADVAASEADAEWDAL